jgi:hypothetical protein
MKMQSWVWVQHRGFAMFLLLLRFRHVLKIHARAKIIGIGLSKKRFVVDKCILDAKVCIAAPMIIFLVNTTLVPARSAALKSMLLDGFKIRTVHLDLGI